MARVSTRQHCLTCERPLLGEPPILGYYFEDEDGSKWVAHHFCCVWYGRHPGVDRFTKHVLCGECTDRGEFPKCPICGSGEELC